MLITLDTPSFMESLLGFIQEFIPSLEIHRLHIQQQSPTLLQLSVEMSSGQTLWTSVAHHHDRLHLQLDYGWQRIDLWMFANFPVLQADSVHEVAMNGIPAQDIDKDRLQLRGEGSLFDDSLVGLAREMNLSWVELEEVLLSALRDVRKERILVLSGDVGEDPSPVERSLPVPQAGFCHPMFGPSSMHRELEQAF